MRGRRHKRARVRAMADVATAVSAFYAALARTERRPVRRIVVAEIDVTGLTPQRVSALKRSLERAGRYHLLSVTFTIKGVTRG